MSARQRICSISCASAITPRCCIFPPATSWDAATAACSKNFRGTTCRAACADFDAEKEWQSLEALIRETEARAESPEVTEELRRAASKKNTPRKICTAPRSKTRFARIACAGCARRLTEAGIAPRERARLAQHLHVHEEPFRIADPEFSRREPAARRSPWCARRSWNRRSRSRFWAGTKASIPRRRFLICSALFSASFRRNESKCLDLIPVDLVCRGMTLIAAALVARRHAARLSTGDVGRESLRHAPVHRTDRPRPPQILSRAERLAAPAAPEVRRDSGFQSALRKAFRARAKSDRAGDQSQRRADSVRAAAAGAPGARTRKSDQARSRFSSLSFCTTITCSRPRTSSGSAPRFLPRNAPTFGYDARSLDWWDYWINVHIPALRKWCYPLIEGRQPEARPRRSVPLRSAPRRAPRSAAGATPAAAS